MPAFTAHLLDEGHIVPAREEKRKNSGGWAGAWEGAVEAPPTDLAQLVHLVEEVLVGLRQLELVEQELHRLDGLQLGERLAEQADLLELVLLEEQLFLACPRLLDIDRREDALV